MTASPHRGDQCQTAISQPGSPGPETRSAGLVRLGMLSAAAVAVYVFEGLIPMPLPWARLGLSNVVVVVTLFGFGVRPAILVAAVRIVAGNLLLGIMLSPAFLFSIAGSCAALAVMAVARWKMVPPLSVVGVSVAGAVANNVVQVMVFVGLFAHTGIVANLLGLFMLLGVGVGLVTGLIAAAILPRVLRGAGANLVVTMFLIFVAVAAFTLGCGGQNPRVLLRTDLGDIIIEVYPDRAPITATNFLRYVNEGRLRGATFYRAVRLDNQPNNAVKIEVIQGGLGDDPDSLGLPPIPHETTAKTGILHKDGTVSMARAEPGTASSEIFICIGDQPELDFGGRRNPDGQGFAAFGKVLSGMDVVRKIQSQPADGQSLTPDIPIREVLISSRQ